jgi:ABC-2 type transport system permease protein
MSLSKLLFYRLKIFLANFTRGEGRKRIVRIVIATVVLGTLIGFSFGAYAIFRALDQLGDDAFAIASFIVATGLLTLLIVAFVFDILATANIFFLSSDLNLLMAAPLKTSRIFVLKYLEALGSGSLFTVIFGIPMLIGFGAAFGAPAAYFVAIPPIVIIFLSIPVSVGTLCGLLISRYVPAARVKEVLSVVGGLLGLGMWLTIQVLRRQLARPGQLDGFAVTVKSAVSYGDHILLRLLPSQLAARGLTSLVSGEALSAITPFVNLTAVAGVLFVISIVLAQRMYVTGWTRTTPGVGKAKPRGRRPGRLRIFGWLPPVERSILTTTFHLFIRDPQQVMPVATITIMMAVLPFVMGRPQSGPIVTPGLILRSLTALTFVGALHLCVSATGIDGRGFWIILSAPCPSMRKLVSKLLISVCFFVPLAVVIGFILSIADIVEWSSLPKMIWLAACMSCTGGSIGIFLGISYTDWEWEIPKRMLRTAGRMIMLAIMLIFLIAVALTIRRSGTVRDRSGSGLGGWFVYPVIGVVAAAVTGGFLRLSADKLDEMEWKI